MPSSDTPGKVWYLDASVALRILLGHSPEAVAWYDERQNDGEAFVSSRILELELVRVLRRECLEVQRAYELVDELTLVGLGDAIVADAAAIRPHIKSLDAIHLATAQRIGAGSTVVVTHDATMAGVAEQLGFDVFDPVRPAN